MVETGREREEEEGGGGQLSREGQQPFADEKDIEFQLALTYIYIQPTWQCLGKQFNTPIQTAALHHLHKLIEKIKILLKSFFFFSSFPAHIFRSL